MSTSNGYHVTNGQIIVKGHTNGHMEEEEEEETRGEVNAHFIARLEDPWIYSTGKPGKAIRDQMMNGMNHWLGVEPPVLDQIKQLIGMLHEASLLIDDIQDSSKMRRGQPAAYLIYGQSEVINIANLKYFEAGKLALELSDLSSMKVNPSEASRIFHEWMVKLHQGQGLDIYWRDHYICPSIDQYTDMVLKKTGGLMLLAFELMFLFRTKHSTDQRFDKKSGHAFIATFSRMFQIRDDFCNLWDSKYAANKSYCEDLTEGKFSWVIVQGILKEQQAGRSQIIAILKQRTTDDAIKKHCCKLLESLGVLAETRETLLELEADMHRQIDYFGGNELFSKIVDQLSIRRVDIIPSS